MNYEPDSYRNGPAPVEAVLSTQILSKNGKALREDGWTHEKRALFLEALSGGVSIESAAKAAGMTRSSAYALKCRDPLFSSQWADAIQEGVMAAAAWTS